MAKAKQDQLYIARETFWFKDQLVTAGQTRIREGHPLLKSHGGAFEPVAASRGFDVEQATAAPGERRRVSLTTTPEGADDGEA